jgi:hypothetical protein
MAVMEDVGIFNGLFGLFYGHFAYFVAIRYRYIYVLIYFFGMLYQEKSGNPAVTQFSSCALLM